ncbi:MAG: SsrA-binding protein SmpB [Candidatus Kapaibacteriales bacterium]
MGNEKPNEKNIKGITTNKKAMFDFELIDKAEAGIVLLGTEVKSLRAGKCNLRDSYARIDKSNEIWLTNSFIGDYPQANIMNHDNKRRRKLLMHRHQIKKWRQGVEEKGYTIVPVSVYFADDKVKVQLSLARPKKKYDKRETIKERETKRDLQRRLKGD